MGHALHPPGEVFIHFVPGVLGPGRGQEPVLRHDVFGMQSGLLQHPAGDAPLAQLVIQRAQRRQRAGIGRVMPQRPGQIAQRAGKVQLQHAHHGRGDQQPRLVARHADGPAHAALTQRPVPGLPRGQPAMDQPLGAAGLPGLGGHVQLRQNSTGRIAVLAPGVLLQLVIGTVHRQGVLPQGLQAPGQLRPGPGMMPVPAEHPAKQLRGGLPVARLPQLHGQGMPGGWGVILLRRAAHEGKRVQRLPLPLELAGALAHPAAGQAEGIHVLIHRNSFGANLIRGKRGPAGPSGPGW